VVRHGQRVTPAGVFATTSRIRASSSSTRGASTFKRYTIAARASWSSRTSTRRSSAGRRSRRDGSRVAARRL